MAGWPLHSSSGAPRGRVQTGQRLIDAEDQKEQFRWGFLAAHAEENPEAFNKVCLLGDLDQEAWSEVRQLHTIGLTQFLFPKPNYLQELEREDLPNVKALMQKARVWSRNLGLVAESGVPEWALIQALRLSRASRAGYDLLLYCQSAGPVFEVPFDLRPGEPPPPTLPQFNDVYQSLSDWRRNADEQIDAYIAAVDTWHQGKGKVKRSGRAGRPELKQHMCWLAMATVADGRSPEEVANLLTERYGDGAPSTARVREALWGSKKQIGLAQIIGIVKKA